MHLAQINEETGNISNIEDLNFIFCKPHNKFPGNVQASRYATSIVDLAKWLDNTEIHNKQYFPDIHTVQDSTMRIHACPSKRRHLPETLISDF